jgi:GNAT superfamily N-acetyltransferase
MRSPAVAVRPFRAADQAAARELILAGLAGHVGFLDETLNPDLDDIAGRYTGQGRCFLVAERAGRIVGAGGLVPERPGAARLVRVSVAAAVRGRGVGRALVERLLSVAWAAGCTEVVVETNHDWADAVAFYRRLGFEESGRDAASIHFRIGRRALLT